MREDGLCDPGTLVQHTDHRQCIIEDNQVGSCSDG
jgi:hypothetical protein